MPNRSNTPKSQPPSAKAKDKKHGGKAADGVLRTNDVTAAQALAADELASAVPFNATKKVEYGIDNAKAPVVFKRSRAVQRSFFFGWHDRLRPVCCIKQQSRRHQPIIYLWP